jgi:hypothetical protein
MSHTVAHLKFFDSIDDSSGYDFHTLMVVQCEKTGNLFYGTDSGCSCPSPFEDFHSEADFTRITLRSYESFACDVERWDVSRAEKDALLSKVYRVLRGRGE